jgi:hypothetical protein
MLVVMAAVGCSRSLPPRVDPPADGQPAEIGVAYGVTLACAIPFELGGRWWVWKREGDPWQLDPQPFPFSIWAPVSPRNVSGIVTLSAPDSAIFRADEDGDEFQLTGQAENAALGGGCL